MTDNKRKSLLAQQVEYDLQKIQEELKVGEQQQKRANWVGATTAWLLAFGTIIGLIVTILRWLQ